MPHRPHVRPFDRSSRARDTQHRPPTVSRYATNDGAHTARTARAADQPLVLVAGHAADLNDYAWLTPWLEPHFRLSIVHRCPAPTEDGGTLALESEFEHLAAAVDAVGAPVDAFAYSFGATLLLGAMPLTRYLRRAVLYEPGAGVGPPTDDVDHVAMDSGPGARRTGFPREVVAPSREPTDRHRSRRAVQMRSVDALAAERRAEAQWTFGPDSYRSLIPTLLVLGSESPSRSHQATEIARAALPNSRVTLLDRQAQSALFTAPRLLAEHIAWFLGLEDASSGDDRR
jgi:hypothetical protein